jgi:hypothetical protein
VACPLTQAKLNSQLFQTTSIRQRRIVQIRYPLYANCGRGERILSNYLLLIMTTDGVHMVGNNNYHTYTMTTRFPQIYAHASRSIIEDWRLSEPRILVLVVYQVFTGVRRCF